MKQSWTGERLETFIYDENTLEHLHRYAIAADLVKDKVVLDLACGEGYGCNLLAGIASQVTGADIDTKAIEAAKKKYKLPNLSFIEAPVENLPFPSGSFDVVTSFETLEHTGDHQGMMAEIKRVLKPDGTLIMSTPDKTNYSDLRGFSNHFHIKELYKSEFIQLIEQYFRHSYFLDQRLMISSVALRQQAGALKLYEGSYQSVNTMQGLDPFYVIAIASDEIIEEPASSLFTSDAVLETAVKEREAALKRTVTYQLGHTLLFPLKIIRKLFQPKPPSHHD